VEGWLLEDCPSFDYGGFVVGSNPAEATLWLKATGVLAGVPFFNHVFELVECKVEWIAKEGQLLNSEKEPRIAVAKVYGQANHILLGERPALNMLARASGIATRARKLIDLKKKHSWTGIIAGTRKTTPGFRIVEKYAMLVGGCETHRIIIL